MVVDSVHALMNVIDDNKDHMSEKDYLQACNLLKEIYNNVDCMQQGHSNDEELDVPYHHAEFIKQIIGVLVIVTNMANILIFFYTQDSSKKNI
jgi:hypothetical protein